MRGEHRRIRCLVADDHPAIVSAVCDFLEGEGMEVVARARDGAEALAKIRSTLPALAIVDLRMQGCSGIEVARQAPETPVILYTGHADRAMLVDAVDAGARGYVLKEAPLADLLRAIETVLAGGAYVDPVLAGPLATEAARTSLPMLTHRERDVLRLLADGRSNEQIGSTLHISAETVRTHVRKAMRKLEASTRTQAVATAIRQSLIA
jgi:DNA-binding NarL/FixJ family response regulator